MNTGHKSCKPFSTDSIYHSQNVNFIRLKNAHICIHVLAHTSCKSTYMWLLRLILKCQHGSIMYPSKCEHTIWRIAQHNLANLAPFTALIIDDNCSLRDDSILPFFQYHFLRWLDPLFSNHQAIPISATERSRYILQLSRESRLL